MRTVVPIESVVDTEESVRLTRHQGVDGGGRLVAYMLVAANLKVGV